MSTRSTYRVIEKGIYEGKEWENKICLLYIQSDGYPEGHPSDTAIWLSSGRLVNGLSFSDENKLVFNGASCLAAQLVAKFKDGPGGAYLHPVSQRGKCGEDYLYDIIIDSSTNEITFKAYDNETGWGPKDRLKTKLLYSGPPANYHSWVENVYQTEE